MASTVVNVAKLSCTLNRKTAAKHNVSTSVQTLCAELMPKSLILVGLKVTDCNLCATWAQSQSVGARFLLVYREPNLFQ